VDRDGGVGGRGWARHAGRRRARRVRGELDAELAHDQLSRLLAVLPRRAVHGRGAVLPGRHPRRRRTTVRPYPPGDGRSLRGVAHARGVPERAMTEAGAIIYCEDVTVDFDGFKAL